MSTNEDKSGDKADSQEGGGDTRLAQALQAWMIVRLAEELRVKPVDLDPGLPFMSYGLDSIVAFSLTGELADLVGQELPSTLFWDFPRIELLASHLAQEINDGKLAESVLAEINHLLSRIEELSENEILESDKERK